MIPKELGWIERDNAGCKVFEYGILIPVSCVYFLYLADKLKYIGQSVNLKNRLAQHKSGGKVFDNVFYIDVPKEALYEVENTLIARLKPEDNKLTRQMIV